MKPAPAFALAKVANKWFFEQIVRNQRMLYQNHFRMNVLFLTLEQIFDLFSHRSETTAV